MYRNYGTFSTKIELLQEKRDKLEKLSARHRKIQNKLGQIDIDIQHCRHQQMPEPFDVEEIKKRGEQITALQLLADNTIEENIQISKKIRSVSKEIRTLLRSIRKENTSPPPPDSQSKTSNTF